jgi:hypothetical protein
MALSLPNSLKKVRLWLRIPAIILLDLPSHPPPQFEITMAAKPNNLYRQSTGRLEQAAAVDKQIAKLEEDIRRLKIDFDIYFNGAAKRPPLEARARLEAFLKRLLDNRSLSYGQRYKLNSLVARFTSYRELWRRTMRSKGEELF